MLPESLSLYHKWSEEVGRIEVCASILGHLSETGPQRTFTFTVRGVQFETEVSPLISYVGTL
jgi:hypothetical protein